MPEATANDSNNERPDNASQPADPGSRQDSVPDEAAQGKAAEGDHQKIDRSLDELKVSTTESGKDQTDRPDTEGSNSSSKNLDEQGD